MNAGTIMPRRSIGSLGHKRVSLDRFSGAAFERLFTAAQSRELDRLAQEHGIPGIVLMKRAGRAAWTTLRRALAGGRNDHRGMRSRQQRR